MVFFFLFGRELCCDFSQLFPLLGNYLCDTLFFFFQRSDIGAQL